MEGIFDYFWLRFAELARTKIIADPSAFEIDEEFFKLNPQTSKEAFTEMLWERWKSGKKNYLTNRKNK